MIKIKEINLAGKSICQDCRLEENDADDVDDLSALKSKSFISDKIQFLVEKSAETRLGQMMTKIAYRTVEIIEDTTKWSLPSNDPMDLCRDLYRPLPWILFLPLIVWLRLLRAFLTIGGKAIGKGPVTPQVMIGFLQSRRRSIRAIRLRGLRAQKRNYPIAVEAVKREEKMASQLSKEVLDCSSDDDLTVNEMLIKYANKDMDSDADPDFMPSFDNCTNYDEDTESTTSSSLCSTIANDDDDDGDGDDYCVQNDRKDQVIAVDKFRDVEQLDQIDQEDHIDQLKCKAVPIKQTEQQQHNKEFDQESSATPALPTTTCVIKNAQASNKFDINLAVNGLFKSTTDSDSKDSTSININNSESEPIKNTLQTLVDKQQENIIKNQLYQSNLAPFSLINEQSLSDSQIKTSANHNILSKADAVENQGITMNCAGSNSNSITSPETVTPMDSAANNLKQRQILKMNITSNKSKTLTNQKNYSKNSLQHSYR